jgi:hypothetical protein
VISRQGDLEQVDERLDTLRRFEKERPHLQRCLPLMVALLRLPAIMPPKTKVICGRGRGSFATAEAR